jgi:hypothetical protein
MWISADSQPYLPEVNSGRSGFFFSITNIPVSEKI